ncbi:MAG: inorganic diphosphatase [Candidatus Eremiobacteraeota bacterium]|nr:inorganic diphosphatase [Candidatus Eremiobacteraeota bacterium]
MKKNINATHYDRIPSFPNKGKDRIVHGIIETVKDSPCKYALKNDYGIIEFREPLAKGLEWPYDYGFIPQTLADDGDPMDLLYLSEYGSFSGCLIQARLLGSIKLKKNGVENDRLIGAPLRVDDCKQPTDGYDDISDLPRHELDKICKFLSEYSERQGNDIELIGPIQADAAMKTIMDGRKKYKKSQK